MSDCPIFKALGKQGKKDCSVCPFSARCPEDILDDAVAEVIKVIGEYYANRE